MLFSRDLFPVDNCVVSSEHFSWPYLTLSAIPLVWKIFPLPFLTPFSSGLLLSLWWLLSLLWGAHPLLISQMVMILKDPLSPLFPSQLTHLWQRELIAYLHTQSLLCFLQQPLHFKWAHTHLGVKTLFPRIPCSYAMKKKLFCVVHQGRKPPSFPHSACHFLSHLQGGCNGRSLAALFWPWGDLEDKSHVVAWWGRKTRPWFGTAIPAIDCLPPDFFYMREQYFYLVKAVAVLGFPVRYVAHFKKLAASGNEVIGEEDDTLKSRGRILFYRPPLKVLRFLCNLRNWM